MQKDLSAAVIMNVQHSLRTSNMKNHSLILLFDCERSSDYSSYETLKFAIIGSCDGDRKGLDEEEYFDRLSELIRKEKLMTYAGYRSLLEVLNRETQGGWSRSRKKLQPLIWKSQRDETELKADVDPGKWASGKVVISLRASG